MRKTDLERQPFGLSVYYCKSHWVSTSMSVNGSALHRCQHQLRLMTALVSRTAPYLNVLVTQNSWMSTEPIVCYQQCEQSHFSPEPVALPLVIDEAISNIPRKDELQAPSALLLIIHRVHLARAGHAKLHHSRDLNNFPTCYTSMAPLHRGHFCAHFCALSTNTPNSAQDVIDSV